MFPRHPSAPAAGQRDHHRTGHVASAWTTIATVWAKVKFLRGEEALAAATVYPKAHAKITVRAGGTASSLQPSDRVELVATGETFEIEGVVPVPGGRPERGELMVWGVAEVGH